MSDRDETDGRNLLGAAVGLALLVGSALALMDVCCTKVKPPPTMRERLTRPTAKAITTEDVGKVIGSQGVRLGKGIVSGVNSEFNQEK